MVTVYFVFVHQQHQDILVFTTASFQTQIFPLFFKTHSSASSHLTPQLLTAYSSSLSYLSPSFLFTSPLPPFRTHPSIFYSPPTHSSSVQHPPLHCDPSHLTHPPFTTPQSNPHSSPLHPHNYHSSTSAPPSLSLPSAIHVQADRECTFLCLSVSPMQ